MAGKDSQWEFDGHAGSDESGIWRLVVSVWEMILSEILQGERRELFLP